MAREKENNEEANKLSQALKEAFVGTEGISELMSNNIKSQGGSMQRLKKFVDAMISQASDPALKNSVSQHIYEQLVIAITRSNLTEDEIINSMRIVEMVADDAL